MPKKPSKSSNEDFKRDLKIGEDFENKVFDFLNTQEGFKGTLSKPLKRHAGFDFLIGDKPVEVKCDKRAVDTGNLAFESMYRQNPSGIFRTSHQLWVHGVGSEYFFLFNSDELRQKLLDLHEQKLVKYMPYLGDGSSGYLMSIEKLIKNRWVTYERFDFI